MRTVQLPLCELTHAYLRQILRYSKTTGEFTWLVSAKTGKMKAGMRAGCVVHTANGDYRMIRPTRAFPLVHEHRLAVFYVTGEWPKHTVDHKNRIGTDNRWRNLRAATSTQNALNKGIRPTQSGYRGVHQKGKYFTAIISLGKGQRRYLGSFPSGETAARAWNRAARELHGEFAQQNVIGSPQ